MDFYPLISVIVPIYNTSKYLDRCIASIINQTYTNLEIILVDDGSTDNSGEICDRYQNMDRRVTCIHKMNGGLSSSRNAGLDAAKGEFITFIDSDDYVETDMFDHISKAVREKPADLIFIRERSVNQTGRTIYINGNAPTGKQWTGTQADAAKLIIGNQINGMCDKTYRMSLIGDLRVVEGKCHGEDLLFNLQYLQKISSMTYIDCILYSYVSNEDSITHVPYNSHTLDELYFKDKAEELIDKSFPEYSALGKQRSFMARLSIMRKIVHSKQKRNCASIVIEIEEYLKDRYAMVKSHLNFKQRLEYYLLSQMKVVYPLYISLVKIVKRKKENSA